MGRKTEHLEEFIQEERAALARFKDDWLKQHEKNPLEYPLDMQKGDWDEQFALFCDSEMSKL